MLVALAIAKDPDIFRDMVSLVESRGYPIERHYAETPDGYILGMFRMPAGKMDRDKQLPKGKPVVYLNHALLDSSWAFVCNGEEQSLGFILADAGYDVWFGNNRGNVYSLNHTIYDTDSAEFWNFSYDEMALIDLPTHIEYVLAATGASKLSYIGHSQGTIQAFAGFAMNQTLAAKVNLFLAMAPVTYVHLQESVLMKLGFFFRFDKSMRLFGLNQFLTDKSRITQLGAWLCQKTPDFCDSLVSDIVGPSKHLNASRMAVYTSQTPAGTSTKNMVHWGQGIRKEGFQMYDYGVERNMEYYHQKEPPTYPLEEMKVPTVLLSGGNDYLADPKDIDILVSKLPEKTLLKHIVIPTYAHLDFTWAKDAHELIYPQMLEFLAAANDMAKPALERQAPSMIMV